MVLTVESFDNPSELTNEGSDVTKGDRGEKDQDKNSSGVSQRGGAAQGCQPPTSLLHRLTGSQGDPHQGHGSVEIHGHDVGSSMTCVVLTKQNLNFKANRLRFRS